MTDDRIVRSFVDVNLCPVSIVFRYVRIGEDCFHRTLRDTGVAINAGVGVDVESVRQLVKCFNRAHSGAVGIFAVNA